jgi:hypothetical protein
VNIITLDFETYFDDDYSLKKMTTEAYVRDPRFEAHGCAIKCDGYPTTWYDETQDADIGASLSYRLEAIDWANTAVLCHHAQFDGLILSHHYGVKPRAWLDTLSMARLVLGNHLSVSLASLAAHYGLSAKTVPYDLFKGRHWSDLPPDVQRAVGAGAVHDVDLTWDIFCRLAQGFPTAEYPLIDSYIRMFTEPVLIGDTDILGEVWYDEARLKAQMMSELGITSQQLQSADKFCELLKLEGVEIEYKTMKSGQVPAIAKTDDFMRGLLEHDNNRVAALAAARLGVKSTFMQTRAETLGNKAMRGPLTVYLNYCGAGTLRPTGGDKDNWLNFKRGSKIRKAVKAPQDYWIAPVDSSQIECRVLHYLAGGPDEPVIQKFRNKEDPYVDLASLFYKETIYKPPKDDPRKAEMEAKRGMGKQGRLMCGYGAAGKQFKATAKNGLYGPPVDITIEDADAFVRLYRETNPSITSKGGYWNQANRMLSRLAGGDPIEWGPLLVKDQCIWIEGRPMHYETLEYYRPETDEERATLKDFEQGGFWRMQVRRGKWKKMWGSKLTQNICEGVSRVIVTDAMTRIKQRYGIRTLNHPYDELLLLIPKTSDAEQLLEACMVEMRATPPWLPGLPLDCEGALDERYNK